MSCYQREIGRVWIIQIRKDFQQEKGYKRKKNLQQETTMASISAERGKKRNRGYKILYRFVRYLNLKVKVKVYIYNPDIPVGSADFTYRLFSIQNIYDCMYRYLVQAYFYSKEMD